jgi:hypothetical protein
VVGVVKEEAEVVKRHRGRSIPNVTVAGIAATSLAVAMSMTSPALVAAAEPAAGESAAGSLPFDRWPTQATPLDLNDTEIDWRLGFIHDRLEQSRRPAAIWHWSWSAIGVGTLAWQVVEAEQDSDTDDRGQAITEASKAFIGLVDLYWLRPMKARFGADELRNLPQATLSQKLAKLKKSEEILKRNAARAEHRYGWQVHVGNALLNFAGAGAIWATGGGTSDALISAFSGIAGGELMFWTEPQGPRRDLADYRRLTGGTSMVESAREWHFVARPGGIAIARSF